MSSLNAYPPLVHHPSSSKPVSTHTAHTILTTFLHLASLDPAYRPDSTLSERGPESNSSPGNPNLTLHHLNRVKLGLEGTNLGADELEAELCGRGKKFTDGKDEEGGKKRKWSDRDQIIAPVRPGIPKVISTAEQDVDAVVALEADDGMADFVNEKGWQDREDFELAQDDGDVDVNNAQRDPAAAAVDTEGIGEAIIEGESGRLMNIHEELEQKDEGLSKVTTHNRVNAPLEHQEREQVTPAPVNQRPLTQEEKQERKRLKKIRTAMEKVTAQPARPDQQPKRRLQTVNNHANDNGNEAVKPPDQRTKKKKKSKLAAESRSR
jgi:hypothetical protein